MEPKSRVVLIHGNRDVRRKLASGLVRSRFEVFEAEGRGDGLPLIYKVRPVVIFTEADDERDETWETCSRIRLFTNTPMVLLTTSRLGSHREAWTSDNALILEPPISAAKAVSAANTLLNGQQDLGPSAQRNEQAATSVGRAMDSTLQDQLTWLSALLSKIKRARGQDQIADSIVLNHLLGILLADWVGLYRTRQPRPASLSDVECLLWPGKKGWTEEYEQFFGARVIEAIVSQQLILQTTSLTEGRPSAERKGSPLSVGDSVIIPLIGRERVYGALTVIRRSSDRGAFTPIQIQFVNTVGEALALAMDNADLVRQTRETAIIDQQTGIFSNAYLERIVRMESERRNRYGRPFSLILLDWGTGQSGDSHAQTCLASRLEQVASVVQKQLRATDVVARRGDKGIAFVLPETDTAQAQRVADRLLRLVQASHPGLSSERCPDLKARVSTTLAD
jgi:diguanylate cyclase (GGDEF)-like protein